MWIKLLSESWSGSSRSREGERELPNNILPLWETAISQESCRAFSSSNSFIQRRVLIHLSATPYKTSHLLSLTTTFVTEKKKKTWFSTSLLFSSKLSGITFFCTLKKVVITYWTGLNYYCLRLLALGHRMFTLNKKSIIRVKRTLNIADSQFCQRPDEYL